MSRALHMFSDSAQCSMPPPAKRRRANVEEVDVSAHNRVELVHTPFRMGMQLSAQLKSMGQHVARDNSHVWLDANDDDECPVPLGDPITFFPIWGSYTIANGVRHYLS